MSTIGRRIGKSATWRSKPIAAWPSRIRRDVGAGAAHVEGDHVGPPGAAGDLDRADGARRGPGERGADRQMAGARERHQPAARLVDADLGLRQPLGQRRLEARQVAHHHRLQIGVQRRGREALVLAELGLHLRGQGEMDLGQGGPQRRGDRLLVARIEVAEQKADRAGLGAAGAHLPTAAANSRSSIARCTEPSARIRSASSKRRSRGTRGGGKSA